MGRCGLSVKIVAPGGVARGQKRSDPGAWFSNCSWRLRTFSPTTPRRESPWQPRTVRAVRYPCTPPTWAIRPSRSCTTKHPGVRIEAPSGSVTAKTHCATDTAPAPWTRTSSKRQSGRAACMATKVCCRLSHRDLNRIVVVPHHRVVGEAERLRACPPGSHPSSSEPMRSSDSSPLLSFETNDRSAMVLSARTSVSGCRHRTAVSKDSEDRTGCLATTSTARWLCSPERARVRRSLQAAARGARIVALDANGDAAAACCPA